MKEDKMKEEREAQEEATKEEEEKIKKAEPKTEEETHKEIKELSEKTAYIESVRLKELKEKIDESEKRLDSKIEAFKKFVENTEIGGRTLAALPEKSEEEKTKEAANKLLEGTGLRI